MARLHRSSASTPGIRRQGRGKGFEYFESGVTIGGVLKLSVVGDEGDIASLHGEIESAVLALLADDYRATGVEQAGELEALAAAS